MVIHADRWGRAEVFRGIYGLVPLFALEWAKKT